MLATKRSAAVASELYLISVAWKLQIPLSFGYQQV